MTSCGATQQCRSRTSGAGLPVVLLHGARTSATMWRPQLEALHRAGRTARAVDLPGHGVRRGERFSVQAGHDAISAAVDDVGGRALVVGLSLGGYLAIGHAARNPHQVAGLVAAGCSTSPGGAPTWLWRQAVRVIDRLPDAGAGLNDALVRRAVSPQAAADLAEGGFALSVMADVLEEMSAVRPVEDLPRLRCPVWLVNGRYDHFRAGELAYRRAAPGARVVIVPRSTHLVSLVQPVAFTRVLLQALDEVDHLRARAAAR